MLFLLVKREKFQKRIRIRMTLARLGGLCIYSQGNSHDPTSGYEVRYFYVIVLT